MATIVVEAFSGAPYAVYAVVGLLPPHSHSRLASFLTKVGSSLSLWDPMDASLGGKMGGGERAGSSHAGTPPTTANRGCESLPEAACGCGLDSVVGQPRSLCLSAALSLSLFLSGGGAVSRVLVWHCSQCLLHSSLGRLAPLLFSSSVFTPHPEGVPVSFNVLRQSKDHLGF